MAPRSPIGNASSRHTPPRSVGRTARRARRAARPPVSDRKTRRARSLRPRDDAKRTRDAPGQCRDASITRPVGRRRSIGRRGDGGSARGADSSPSRTSRRRAVGPASRSITLRGDPVHVHGRGETSCGRQVPTAAARVTTLVHPVTRAGDEDTMTDGEVHTSARVETFSARSVSLRVREVARGGERLSSSFDSRQCADVQRTVVA